MGESRVIGTTGNVKWSTKFRKWICENGRHTCVANPKGEKTVPCSNCEGYRAPPRERRKPGRKPTKRDESLAFKGRWVPNGRGTMIPIFDEGQKDDDY